MPDLRSLSFASVSRYFQRQKYVSLDDPESELPLNSPPPAAASPQAPPLPDLASPQEPPLPDLPRSASAPPKAGLGIAASFSWRRSSLAAAGSPTLRRSKSDVAEPAPAAARAAVEKFLSGPEPESEEERHRRESMDVLRKLSASGRVPGYVY